MTQRKLVYALIISLGLNLFLIGLGAGIVYSKSHHHSYFKRMTDDLKHLPPEIREKHQKAFNSKYQSIKENREKMQVLRQQLADEISKPEFDRDKTKSLFEQINAIRGQNTQASQEMMLNTLADLPLEAREKFAKRMKKRKMRSGQKDR